MEEVKALFAIIHADQGVRAIFYLSVFTFSFYALKGLVSKLFGNVTKFFFLNIEVHYSDEFMSTLELWFDEHKTQIHFIREFQFSTRQDDTVVPGYGTALINIPKLPFIILNRAKDEGKKGIYDKTDIITLKLLTFRKASINKVVDSIKECGKKKKSIVIRVNDSYHWDRVKDLNERAYKNVFLQNNALEVMDKIKEFLSMEDWYYDHNIKYRMGILLHGVPGTGKSTIIAAIATHFSMNIYLMKDGKFDANLMCNVPKNSIIVLEDIDLSSIGDIKRKPEKQTFQDIDDFNNYNDHKDDDDEDNMLIGTEKMNLNAALNALDGIISYEGSIFIATTNNIDALDDALIRPGRIDIIQEIPALSIQEQKGLLMHFYKDQYQINNLSSKERTIAEVQVTMQKNAFNFEQAIIELNTQC